jgi:hypothetical protein
MERIQRKRGDAIAHRTIIHFHATSLIFQVITTSWNSREPLAKVGRDVGDNELAPDDYRARDVARMAQSQITGHAARRIPSRGKAIVRPGYTASKHCNKSGSGRQR